MKGDERLSAELLAQLGEKDFLRLVETYGGRRLLVPLGRRKTRLNGDLGDNAARKLIERYANNLLRVPLAREFRVQQYRRAGLPNAEIAGRIGCTETTVERIVRRLVADPRSGVKSRQLDLFADRQ